MMIIEENKVVSLTYELKVDDEQNEVVENVDENSPLTFLFGRGNLLPDFEENIRGLKEGDTFDFKLQPEKAYGQSSDDAVIDLPKNTFEVDGKIAENLLKVGNTIPMQDTSGNRLSGVVLEVGEESVKMDFNHPLADKTLIFKGKIKEVREATQEEIEQGEAQQECSQSDGEEEGEEE